MKMVTEDHTLDQTKLANDHNQKRYFSHEEQEEEEEEEKEETLSFCDLPIHSDSFKWEDDFSSSSKLGHSSSFENDRYDDEDIFEFFSDELTSSNPNSNRTDIVFCGKIIPYKSHNDTVTASHVPKKTDKENQKQKKNKKSKSKNKKKSIFRFFITRNRKRSNDKKSPRKSSCVDGFPVGKVTRVSVMAASSSSPMMIKPRWYLYMFGIVRFRTEIELKDMRSRQSRQRSSTMFSILDDDKEESSTIEKAAPRRKRLWWLLRALGCGSHVAKAAYGSNSSVRHW